MTTAKEKLVKIKDKLKRNAVKAGIVVASMATLTACPPKHRLSEVKENVEQVSKLDQYIQKTHQRQIAKYKQMISEGKNLDERRSLIEAINWDNLEGAEILLNAGADPNLPMAKDIRTVEGKTSDMSLNQTPIFYAKSFEMVKLLEKYGADLNHKDRHGRQPLFFLSGYMPEGGMLSAEWNEKTASYLLEKGNSLDNLQQFRPDNAYKIKFCLEHGIKRDMQELLMQTIELADGNAVRTVLWYGGKKYINTLYTDKQGHTDLPIAKASRGNLSHKNEQKIIVLISKGADIHKECDYGSALRTAEEAKDESKVSLLKQCEAAYIEKMQKMTMSKER